LTPALRVAATLAAGAGFALLGCSKKPAEEPFTCERIQLRAEKCEATALALVRKGIQEREEPDAGEQTFKMFEIRFKQKLEKKQTQKQCEKYQGDPAHADRITTMKDCYRAEDCEGFAKCMLEM